VHIVGNFYVRISYVLISVIYKRQFHNQHRLEDSHSILFTLESPCRY